MIYLTLHESHKLTIQDESSFSRLSGENCLLGSQMSNINPKFHIMSQGRTSELIRSQFDGGTTFVTNLHNWLAQRLGFWKREQVTVTERWHSICRVVERNKHRNSLLFFNEQNKSYQIKKTMYLPIFGF